MIGRTGEPVTAGTLAADLRTAGVAACGTVIAHVAMSRLGWVAGAAQAVVEGLTAALGPDGTPVMPTQSAQLSDPSGWSNPPIPERWWPEVRAALPAYDRDATPTRGVGAVPECFRGCAGVRRSAHPLTSFAARGPSARQVLEPHPLEHGLGEGSPLTRLYDLGAQVLLLGAGHGSNTALHLAEHRCGRAPDTTESAPVRVDGERRWLTYRTTAWDSGDFDRLGADYRAAGGELVAGRVGAADTLVIPIVALVDFAVGWFRRHRPPL